MYRVNNFKNRGKHFHFLSCRFILGIAISHFVTICAIFPDKNDCQSNNIHCRIHLELHLPTNIGRKIAIHFSELFIFMKQIIRVLKSTSYQPELFSITILEDY